MGPTLSLCMIAKDEASMIGQALQSVRNLVDEIILVDTGSTDDTPRIGESFGAKVLTRRWEGDFSAARNFSLSAAACDWVLVLDADEAIAPRDHDVIRQHLCEKTTCFSLAQRHYVETLRMADVRVCKGEYPEFERSYSGFKQSRLCRLFPNRCGLHFVGAVYEFVEPVILKTPELSLRLSPVPIHHYGHIHAVRAKKQKNEFYSSLLEEKARTEDTWKSWYDFGVCMLGSMKLSASRQAFEKAYAKKPTELGLLKQYGTALNLLGEHEMAIDLHNQALAINYAHPELHLSIAMIYVRINRPIFAEAHFRRAIELQPECISAYASLGHLLICQRRVAEACEFLEKVVEMQPNFIEARIDLAAAYEILGRQARARDLLTCIKEDQLPSDYYRALAAHILRATAASNSC